ncbi:hypothetical protein [Streptomyces sp. CS014]|uniref:hypothetical protein n=1 Tax=Streptomyces sp. CS014 TaxID=2162707 RepID=UPI000D5136EC|nr:hypothetical protein [Streptomyces sp. CS014]PVD04448.1 hypothetical protein DBP12_03215 [Streptomyces sp. CS014]
MNTPAHLEHLAQQLGGIPHRAGPLLGLTHPEHIRAATRSAAQLTSGLTLLLDHLATATTHVTAGEDHLADLPDGSHPRNAAHAYTTHTALASLALASAEAALNTAAAHLEDLHPKDPQ